MEIGIKMRLDKFLTHCGFGSRTQVKKLIREGIVTVNGKQIVEVDFKINPEEDVVEIDGMVVKFSRRIYIMMNKPKGYVCSNDDPMSLTVFSLISDDLKHRDLHTVGRLDKDAEGLLIITDDGEYTHKVISPKKRIEKEYLVRLEKEVDEERLKEFENGIILDDGYKTLPAKYTIIDSTTVKLCIYEGKYHQVKRMFEAIGNKVVDLKRRRLGGLNLDESLKPGEYRVMKEEEAYLVFGK